MNQNEYTRLAELMYKSLPKQETPVGQKFHIGDIVKISKPSSWFSQKTFNKDKNRLYEISYSYRQKYGGITPRDLKIYYLNHLFENTSSSWYNEDELELVKSTMNKLKDKIKDVFVLDYDSSFEEGYFLSMKPYSEVEKGENYINSREKTVYRKNSLNDRTLDTPVLQLPRGSDFLSVL